MKAPSRVTRLCAIAAALALVASSVACNAQNTRSPSISQTPGIPRGGTLRLGVPGDFPPPSTLATSGPEAVEALDPQGLYFYDSMELFRCCLLRTLVSYVGAPTDQGGTVLQPDLALSLPEVSADGLTWTFKIRPGTYYAPPLQTTEVTSADFVRPWLRRVREPELGFGHEPGIEGVADYVAGVSTTISGLQTPDRHTLRVKLVRPAGDLPIRFSWADTAPIPPSPTDPNAPFGVATGHDADYGRFLVATGPYMVSGADQIDFTQRPEDQIAASGFDPGRSLTLVRNPTWVAAPDALRPAYVDRMEFTIGGTLEELSAGVDEGRFDSLFYSGPPPQAPLEQVSRYLDDPTLGHVHVNSRDFVRGIAMNLALPPFDDIHVRRAASLVLDKARLIELAGGRYTGEAAGHIVLNSLEDDLLLTYDPYRTPNSAGDADAARQEMRLSRYDTDGDGLCDDPACSGLEALALLVSDEQAVTVSSNLSEIGIDVAIEVLPPIDATVRFFNPAERVSFLLGFPYGKDGLSAATFFTSLFDSRTSMSDHMTNGTMVGASPERLAAWGYDQTEMPNIDDRIDACLAVVGGRQVQCWAELDQHLMENVVPWVPYMFERYVRTVSSRVVRYSFDQSIAQPALDQFAVRPEPSPQP